MNTWNFQTNQGHQQINVEVCCCQSPKSFDSNVQIICKMFLPNHEDCSGVNESGSFWLCSLRTPVRAGIIMPKNAIYSPISNRSIFLTVVATNYSCTDKMSQLFKSFYFAYKTQTNSHLCQNAPKPLNW